MGKFDKAIELLSEKGVELGGRLYTLELLKKDDKELIASFSKFLGEDDTMAEFKNLLEAVKLLKEHNNEN